MVKNSSKKMEGVTNKKQTQTVLSFVTVDKITISVACIRVQIPTSILNLIVLT